MNIDQAFESRFIRPADLEGKQWTLKIAGYRTETLPSKFGGARLKPILAFVGAKREFVINRTNSEALKAMWGSETDDWLGKRLTIYSVTFEGKLSLRIKGSPDLREALDLDVRLPKRSPYTMRLEVTQAAPVPAEGRS